MKNRYLLLFGLLSFFVACDSQSVERKHKAKSISSAYIYSDSLNTNSNSGLYDTLIRPFKNSSYSLKVSIFNSESFDEEVSNATITFSKKNQIIFRDSLSCMSLGLDRKDIDRDGVDDILIFHSTGGRANPTYYLYLVKPSDYRINKVRGFENLPNPDIDGNIITSLALAGQDYIYEFYRLKNGELINLGNSITTDMGDTIQYKKVIRLLKKSVE